MVDVVASSSSTGQEEVEAGLPRILRHKKKERGSFGVSVDDVDDLARLTSKGRKKGGFGACLSSVLANGDDNGGHEEFDDSSSSSSSLCVH